MYRHEPKERKYESVVVEEWNRTNSERYFIKKRKKQIQESE